MDESRLRAGALYRRPVPARHGTAVEDRGRSGFARFCAQDRVMSGAVIRREGLGGGKVAGGTPSRRKEFEQ